MTGVAEVTVSGLIEGAASELLFEAGWGGGGNPPATNNAVYLAEILDGTTVLATATVDLSNGSASAGAVVAQPPLPFVAPASGSVTIRFTDQSTGGALNRDLVIRPLTVETDGVETTAIPFLRALTFGCEGATTGTTDLELDGTTPYTVLGTVVVCSAEASDCETTAVQTQRLCDLDPTAEPDEDGRRCAIPFLRHFAYDCAGNLAGFHDTGLDGTTPYAPTQVVDCQCTSGSGLASLIEVPWNLVSVVEDPAGLPRQDFIYTVAPENDPARIGTIRVHVSRQAGSPCAAYDINNLVFSNTSGYTLTLDAVAQEMSYLRVDLLDFDAFEPVGINGGTPRPTRLGGTAGWNAANNRIVPSENNGTGYMYWDAPPETISYTIYNTGGGTSCSALSFQGMSVEASGCCGGSGDASQCSECDSIVLCDVQAGGASVQFLRTICRDCNGAVDNTLDTTLNGAPYTVTGTVTLCGQQADAPVLTGVRRVTGSTVVQNLKVEFPGLQSVSLTVLAGGVNAAMSSGNSQALPAGASVTWSVADNDDSSLAAAAFAGIAASADYFLAWTYKGTAAG
ncbi:hypothetical protein ACQPXT_13300 [Streptomyces sp. CA-100214]